MTERRYGLAVASVFALALGLRLLPLAWSPYPATLDGIGYAALARDTLGAGSLPLGAMRADNLVFTSFLATTAAVLGMTPLRVAQPAVAFVGAASVVAAMAIVRRFAADLGYAPASVRVATVVAGLGLAIDGLYLRRTGVPDEEALAFLLLPLLVLAIHRGVRSGRRAWLGAVAVFLVAFPLTHTFSTLVAGTTLLAWLVAARRQLSTRAMVGATLLVAAFWGYLAAYYGLAGRLGFVVPYVDRVTAHPGLFVAWLVAMALGVWWFRTARRRTQVLVIVALVAPWVVVVLLNLARPVFPGTIASPRALALLLVGYLVPVLLGAVAAPRLASDREGAAVLLSLLAAPVALVGFSLTADLTPEFFGTAMRAQTFAHLPFVALAALGVAGAVTSSRRPAWPTAGRWRRPALVGVLLAALVVTAPVAYVDLDTLAVPSTTTESEFRAAAFAAERVDGPWTGDHVLTRVAGHYHGAPGVMGPTATWLGGGPPPGCGLLSATSWTTTGAHLFPAGPATVSTERYDRTLASRDHVYASAGGYDAFAVSLARPASVTC